MKNEIDVTMSHRTKKEKKKKSIKEASTDYVTIDLQHF